MSCSRRLRLNIFLAQFCFLKELRIFITATGHRACRPTPTKISINVLSPAAKYLA